jgi:hypothetical protein
MIIVDTFRGPKAVVSEKEKDTLRNHAGRWFTCIHYGYPNDGTHMLIVEGMQPNEVALVLRHN